LYIPGVTAVSAVLSSVDDFVRSVDSSTVVSPGSFSVGFVSLAFFFVSAVVSSVISVSTALVPAALVRSGSELPALIEQATQVTDSAAIPRQTHSL